MTLGTRRLIGGLALLAAGLAAFDVITGAEWIKFVGALVSAALS